MKSKKLRKFYDSKKNIYNYVLAPGTLYEIIYNRISSNSKVLDIGCANGNFSSELIKKGCIVDGIEVSPLMAANARKKLTRVIVGNIEELDLTKFKTKYDYILLMDVLEHLFDPFEALVKTKQLLSKKGQIIVSIPNIANWEVRKELLFGRFDSDKTAILEEGHIRFFTNKTARQMFKKAGLKVAYSNLVINYPLILLKIKNRFNFMDLEGFLKSHFSKIAAYQYIFFLKK